MESTSIFIVLLKFSGNKEKAGLFMEEHNNWIRQNIDNHKFLLVGTLKPPLGGGILAYNTTLSEVEKIVEQDPFVREKIVYAEITEIDPLIMNEQLNPVLNH